MHLKHAVQVILPNDTDLVDTLARNGVDISVAEGEQQDGVASLLGNLLFPLIAFAGLFFLFRGSGNNSGNNNPLGGMGGVFLGRPCAYADALCSVCTGMPSPSATALDARRHGWRANGLWQEQIQVPGDP